MPVTSYVLREAPVDFQGNSTEGPGCSTTTLTNCQGNSGNSPSLLVDGETGSLDLNVSVVHAWNGDVSIAFTLVDAAEVRQADLYFYNIPSQGIGLPSTEVYWSNTNRNVPANMLRHTVLDNEDLSQDDNGLRRVSLHVTTNSNDVPDFGFFRIQFTMSAQTSINWLLLSEVNLCETEGMYPIFINRNIIVVYSLQFLYPTMPSALLKETNQSPLDPL